jgi:hypothetical protein
VSGDVRLYHGDCLDVLPTLAAGSVDAVVTDPPYGLEFMGRDWDHGVPGVPYWLAVLVVLKPGGYMLAFGGTRTYHRLACAVEDAGFEVRDCLMWLYGSGFPKGRGCLKPAWEPILLCRKPGPRVLPLGVDECRMPCDEDRTRPARTPNGIYGNGNGTNHTTSDSHPAGRWPANVVHDGGEEVLEAFAAFGSKDTRDGMVNNRGGDGAGYMKGWKGAEQSPAVYGDRGTAARFFYTAKASKAERGEGNNHPTVKPLALLEWLVRLVCPPGGLVLDPFAGSATTGVACLRTGRRFVGVEKDAGYHEIARKRLAEAASPGPLFAAASTGG